jgi:chitin synthase
MYLTLTIKEIGDIEKKEHDDEDNHEALGHGSPCVAGEFKATMDTLLETIEERQPWYVFCINPNDSQVPNQLEGRSVKGQVKALGLAEIANGL